VVIKGSARGGAAGLAAHLQRTDTNEVAELRELRGVAAEDLDGALREMEAVASGARSARHFYHASINTRADEVMTMAQWHQAVDRLEQELGLTGQPRAVVAHVKDGRAHVHIAWSRINIETMRAIPDSHNFRQHEIVARELEREFGHARVQGAHIERAGEARPERTPSHAEMQQAERSGLTPQQAKQQLTEIWNRTDSGQAFAAAIQEQGWSLARGDKRDFVVLDPAGEVHSLGRRIDGTKAKDVRARMADLDAAALPTVDEAKALHRAHSADRQRPEAQQTEQQPASMAPLLRPDLEPNQVPSRPVTSEEIEDGADRARREHLSKTTDAGGLVAQQMEAQQRFKRSWADIREQQKSGKPTPARTDEEVQRARDEQSAHDRARQRDSRER
jgi:hypothetical protein